MKVFVLENGCYSDTRVVGVYSSQENADMASRIFKDDPNVFELELDSYVEAMHRGEVPWFVRLDRTTGDVLDLSEESYSVGTTDVKTDAKHNLYTTCWATSREHAVKIASERRAMFLAVVEMQQKVEKK